MIGKSIRILAIGKLKTKYWKEACEYYVKMISKWQEIEILELKDSDASLPMNVRIEQEAERILNQIGTRDYLIALGENGETPNSKAFAKWLESMEMSPEKPTFIIGGPFGLSEKILARSKKILSLSKMTWPHELARVLLLEQIFRACCIRFNFPYHH